MKTIQEQALTNAKKLIDKSSISTSSKEKKYSKQISSFIQNKQDKQTIIRVLDRGLRSINNKYSVNYLASIFRKNGIPKFFNVSEKIGLFLFIYIGKYFAFISLPLLRYYIIKSCSNYVLFGGRQKIVTRIKENSKLGFVTNINRIGEALLGEKEASKRVDAYIKDLQVPEIKIISIKISTLFSQITAISHNYTVMKIVEKLSILYAEAKNNSYIDDKGEKQYKLINLDMEEYRDMRITADAFMKALDKKEFFDLKAGIALQAYIPDSHILQKELVEWAKLRVKKGGSPIRIRVVKGANMDMEKFEASEKHWELVTYRKKHHTDFNYKRMVEYALQPGNIKAVNLGIASHNLYDISYIRLIAESNNVLQYCYFEMLQGMNDNIAKILAQDGLNIMIYLPFSAKNSFAASISYLIRRLDENTGEDNYLRYVNDLANDNLSRVREIFNKSLLAEEEVEKVKAYRSQNRLKESFKEKEISSFYCKKYIASADTDFSLSNNRKWLSEIKSEWTKKNPIIIPTVIGKDIFRKEEEVKIYNHNTDDTEIVALYSNATMSDVASSVSLARKGTIWREKTDMQRLKIIAKVAEVMREKRGDIIAAANLDVGKPWVEADVEVSEALDFIEYYTDSYLRMKEQATEYSSITPKGVGLVVSPWNFPAAIPCGGIVASLIAGNNTIFKPSNLSILVGFEIAKCFWDAGVPKSALQFIASNNSQIGRSLTKHKDIDFIIFTGSTAVALSILKNKPDVYLAAETGGKNVTFVGRSADLDQTIKDITVSSFSNSGQKCSATSILLLQEDIYNNKVFLRDLADAAASLQVGSGWQEDTKIGPIIKAPSADLAWALTELDKGEEWLLKPKQLNESGTLWSPGIRIGTKKGDKSHLTEFFGPVITIMKAKNIEEALEIINGTDYGLTSAIQSLDDEEINIWREGVVAGNLYINRTSTGAIVLRQPFGGMKNSAYGAGIKAGGENYMTQFINISEDKEKFFIKEYKGNNEILPNIAKLSIKYPDFVKAANSYLQAYENYFSKEIDYCNIVGQSNICRFKKIDNLIIRIEKNDSGFSILARIFAAKLCLDGFIISIEKVSHLEFIKEDSQLSNILNKIVIKEQNLTDFCIFVEVNKTDRIIFSGEHEISKEIFSSSAKSGIYLSKNKVLMNGRLELLQYLQEQSISHNYHRYGYIEK